MESTFKNDKVAQQYRVSLSNLLEEKWHLEDSCVALFQDLRREYAMNEMCTILKKEWETRRICLKILHKCMAFLMSTYRDGSIKSVGPLISKSKIACNAWSRTYSALNKTLHFGDCLKRTEKAIYEANQFLDRIQTTLFPLVQEEQEIQERIELLSNRFQAKPSNSPRS